MTPEDQIIPKHLVLLEVAWGLIANASGGDWTKEHIRWQEAAARWRDQYFAYIQENKG